MRIIILTAALVLSMNLFAQDPFTLSKVIETDSVGKAVLFTAINDWFATTYKSANDVIQMADKESGIIVGNAITPYSYPNISYTCYGGHIKYTIKVYVKDNKIKVEMTNFIHEVRPSNSATCELGMITTAEEYATKGLYKNLHNNVWRDIKTKMDTYFNELALSIEGKTKSVKTDNSW